MHLNIGLPDLQETTTDCVQFASWFIPRAVLIILLSVPMGADAFDLEATELAIAAYRIEESSQPLIFYLPLSPISENDLDRLSKDDADKIYDDVYGGKGVWTLSNEQGAVFTPRAKLDTSDPTQRGVKNLNSLVFIQSCGHRIAKASMGAPRLSKAVRDAFQINDDQIDMKSCGPGVIVVGPLPEPSVQGKSDREATIESVKRLETNLLDRGFTLHQSSTIKVLVSREVEVRDELLSGAVKFAASTTANCGTKDACGPGVTPVGPLPLPEDIYNSPAIRILPSNANNDLFR